MGRDSKIREGKWEQILREIVLQKTQRSQPVVVNEVRLLAEKQIDGISEGFFAKDKIWKGRSREIINDEFETQQAALPSSAATSPEKSKKNNKGKSKEVVGQPKTGRKRKSEEVVEVEKPQKRRKGRAKEDDSEGEEQKVAEQPDASKGSFVNDKDDIDGTRKTLEEDVSKETDEADATVPIAAMDGNEDVPEQSPAAKDMSESEMSVLIDEDPKPKKKRQRGTKTTTTTTSSMKGLKTKKSPKHEAPAPAESDPSASEIKELQRRLVKCGIRKMWFKELAPFPTPQQKIRHLNDMLSEAGMKGRYSDEKAAKIREERELKQDLEAVQEGNKQWGKDENEEVEMEAGRPRRKLAKGLAEIQHLLDEGSGDEDEW